MASRPWPGARRARRAGFQNGAVLAPPLAGDRRVQRAGVRSMGKGLKWSFTRPAWAATNASSVGPEGWQKGQVKSEYSTRVRARARRPAVVRSPRRRGWPGGRRRRSTRATKSPDGLHGGPRARRPPRRRAALSRAACLHAWWVRRHSPPCAGSRSSRSRPARPAGPRACAASGDGRLERRPARVASGSAGPACASAGGEAGAAARGRRAGPRRPRRGRRGGRAVWWSWAAEVLSEIPRGPGRGEAAPGEYDGLASAPGLAGGAGSSYTAPAPT